jgi:outer membrane protein OmpA-like peptidoglycan-associated protein
MSTFKTLAIALLAASFMGLPVVGAFAEDQMSPEEIEQMLESGKKKAADAEAAPQETEAAPQETVVAAEMSAADIQQKLKPQKKTRSIKVMPREQAKAQIDTALEGDIGVVERKKIIEVAKKAELPSLDFSITFGFDSADIDHDSFAQLDTLAEALKSGDLSTYRFLINGHTDSKGSDEYNLALSQQRASAVVDYLVSKHDIDPARLKAIGFGESSLKDVHDGEAAENRRVEIINRP